MTDHINYVMPLDFFGDLVNTRIVGFRLKGGGDSRFGAQRKMVEAYGLIRN